MNKQFPTFKIRFKPSEFEAMTWTGSNLEDIAGWLNNTRVWQIDDEETLLIIPMQEKPKNWYWVNKMARRGDLVIKDSKGDAFVLKNEWLRFCEFCSEERATTD